MQTHRRYGCNTWASSRDKLRFRSYNRSNLTYREGQGPDYSYLDYGFNSLRVIDDRLDQNEKGAAKDEVDQ